MTIAHPTPPVHKNTHKANKFLGQHFLKNPAVVSQIISFLAITPEDFLIEIGPGNGELTKKIATSPFQEYLAIEKDMWRADELKKWVQEEKKEHIEIRSGDALQTLPILLQKNKKNKVFGNIPYYITGYLFRILSENYHSISLGVFMIQKEVAERMCAKTGAMNRLAVFTQIWGCPEILLAVPKKNFSPPPRVDSAVIRITPHVIPLVSPELFPVFEKITKSIFSQPRKKIINNISEIFLGTTAERKTQAEKLLKDAGLSGEERPHDITIPQLITLTKIVYTHDIC